MFAPQRVAHATVTGAVSPVFTAQRGFTATIARASAGVYTLTLTEECDPATSVITLGRKNTLHGSACYQHISDTQIEVRTFDAAAAAADASFSIAVDRTFA